MKNTYVVVEKHDSRYLEEPIVYEAEFTNKKEAMKCFSKTCRDAKEISMLQPVAGDHVPHHQPVYVKLNKMTINGCVTIAETHYNNGYKCWSWKARC